MALGDEWVKKADMLTARIALSIAEVNEKIYAIGGELNGGELKVTEEYDPQLDKWTIKTDMPTARAGLTTTVVNGKIYAIGGFFTGSQAIEEYDPISDSWKTKTTMPNPKFYHSAVSINEKIYVFGGTADFNLNPSLSCLVYDPKLDKWSQLQDIPPKFSMNMSSTVVYNDNVYFFGGINLTNNIPITNIIVYNSKTDNWKMINSSVVPRLSAYAGKINNKAYFIGGLEPQNWKGLSIIEEFDIITEIITERKEMLTPRGSISGSVIKGEIYIMGGTTDWPGALPNDYLSINEVYVSDVNISVNPQDKLTSTWGSIKSIR